MSFFQNIKEIVNFVNLIFSAEMWKQSNVLFLCLINIVRQRIFKELSSYYVKFMHQIRIFLFLAFKNAHSWSVSSDVSLISTPKLWGAASLSQK